MTERQLKTFVTVPPRSLGVARVRNEGDEAIDLQKFVIVEDGDDLQAAQQGPVKTLIWMLFVGQGYQLPVAPGLRENGEPSAGIPTKFMHPEAPGNRLRLTSLLPGLEASVYFYNITDQPVVCDVAIYGTIEEKAA